MSEYFIRGHKVLLEVTLYYKRSLWY